MPDRASIALCVGFALAALTGCDAPAEEERSERVEARADGCEGAEACPPDLAAADVRAQGRAGLKSALAAYQEAGAPESGPWTQWLDTVGGARDTATSGLFWHTDTDAALAEAAQRGVPVLSLRMLGDLRQELSCANSRFFRTVLYADPALSQWLDENFVLHWSSERAVPILEIDYGDGRKVRTTTTGNSAHYVLGPGGQVLDVIPGLYSATGFRTALTESKALYEAVAADRDAAAGSIAEHHRAARDRAVAKFSRMVSGVQAKYVLGPMRTRTWMLTQPKGGSAEASPSAMAAVPIAIGKSMTESPVLRQFMEESEVFALDEELKPAVNLLANERSPSVEISPQSQHLIRRDRPQHVGESDADYAARIEETMDAFERSIAEDELRNEFHLRAVVHQWLSEPGVGRGFEELNARVYEVLFLTPKSDPWLGLVDERVYDGLPEAGVVAMPG